MSANPEKAAACRENLILPRVLAAILFALAACVLVGVVGATAALIAGDRKALKFLPFLAATAWMLCWLGAQLWAGRPIPRLFILGFLLVIGSLPTLALLTERSWWGALLLLGISVPMLLQFRASLRDYPPKPIAPKVFDELA